jgi:sugar phosphate isomerase/epimerase
MRFGLNPKLEATTKRELVHGLMAALEAAAELGFDAVEISLTERMFELGLRTVFGGDLLDLMQAARPSFHLRLFPPSDRERDPGISNPSAYPRSLELRRIIQVIEFFEGNHPLQLYVLHAGHRSSAFETHLKALRRSLDALETLYPGLPIALANDWPGTVLERPPDFLELLDAMPNLRYVFNTGLAYHAVDYNPEAYSWFLRSLSRFEDRLAEIQWSDGAPGSGLNRPLHVRLDRGLDVHRTLRTIGRNPAVVHLFDTVGASVSALARERRAVYNSARL